MIQETAQQQPSVPALGLESFHHQNTLTHAFHDRFDAYQIFRSPRTASLSSGYVGEGSDPGLCSSDVVGWASSLAARFRWVSVGVALGSTLRGARNPRRERSRRLGRGAGDGRADADAWGNPAVARGYGDEPRRGCALGFADAGGTEHGVERRTVVEAVERARAFVDGVGGDGCVAIRRCRGWSGGLPPLRRLRSAHGCSATASE